MHLSISVTFHLRLHLLAVIVLIRVYFTTMIGFVTTIMALIMGYRRLICWTNYPVQLILVMQFGLRIRMGRFRTRVVHEMRLRLALFGYY